MKAIIVDDDLMARTSLSALCDKVEDIEIINQFDNGLDAMRFLSQAEIDLIFLDVEMPDFSGIDMIKTVRNLPHVILVTGKNDYAVEAFELEVNDYLTKPVSLARLKKSIDKILKESNEVSIKEVSDFIFIRVDGRLVKLDFNDLLYVETLGDYVQFFTINNKKYIVHSTLKGIDEKLKHPNFVKVHRSYIVNVSKIVDIEETNLVIAEKVIPISRAQKPVLMSRIKTL